MEYVRDNLRWFRMNLGLGRSEFGELLGWSGIKVWRKESGGNKVSVDDLRKIGERFGVPIALLVGGQNDFDYWNLREDLPRSLKGELLLCKRRYNSMMRKKYLSRNVK